MSFLNSYKEKLSTIWGSNIFRKNFILILLITAIPGIISGLVIHWVSVANVEKELMDIHYNQVEERMKNIDDQFFYLEQSVSNWAFDPRFDGTLLDLDFAYQFQETRDIVKSLRILEKSHPLIEQAELFVDADKSILFNTNYNVIAQDEADILRSMMLKEGNRFQWHYFPKQELETWSENKLALIHNIPGVSDNPFGMIIVTVNHEKLSQLLETLTPYDGGATLLLRNNDELLVSTNDSLSDGMRNSIRQAIEKKVNENSTFPFEWKGVDYSVSYGTMNRMRDKWTYVSFAPISGITDPVVGISRIILVISFSTLFIAVLMTWFASNNIHRPLKKLLHTFVGEDEDIAIKRRNEFELIQENWIYLTGKSEQLQKEVAKQIPQLKGNFLNQLKNGYLYNYTENDLRRRMKSYEWDIRDKNFMLLDVQLTAVYEAEITTKRDESLFTFAAANMIDESAQMHFHQYTTLNDYDLSVSLFLVLEKDHKVKNAIHDFVDRITTSINKILNLKVTITLSEKTDQVNQIPFLFQTVRQGKSYRDLEDENQLIDLSEAKNKWESKQLMYPFEAERKVIQSIRKGQIDETEQLVRTFIKELTEIENKEISIQMGMYQLLASVQQEILRSGIHPNELYNNNDMMDKLSNIRETERMIRWLLDEVVIPYILNLEGRIDIEMKQLVESTKEYIHNHYTDDISLEDCAEFSNTNSYTLSKSFNKILGINFIDYLTGLRIDKAQELLNHTDMKIGDIAESVGYRHSYFNRVFKKQTGVSPSQFRKMKSNG